jgi:ribonuclease E
MTEEALDSPAPQAGEGSEEPRPKPRRRRRGGRGRGRGGSSGSTGSSSSSTGSSETSSDSTEAPAADAPAADTANEESAPKAPRQGSRQGASRSRGTRKSPARKPAPKQAKPDSEDGDPQVGAEDEAPEGQEEGSGQRTSTGTRRRRRRRRKPSNGEKAPSGNGEADDDASGAAVAGLAAAEPKTRAKGQTTTRRPTGTRTSRAARRGTVTRRRREPAIVPERRSDKTMLVTEHHERIQIVVLEGRELVEHYVAETGSTSMVGNIYLGRVQNVLPGMEAAFVDLGRGRNAVLYAGEVSYDEEVEGGDRRIEQVLKPGQSIVVQVTKDPLRGKGARLTAQISLPGRYLVYVPDGGASGISRRLPDSERDRLKKIVKEIRPSEAGVIVRTAAEGASADELAADLERLKKAWESIKGKSKRGRPPKTLYEEPELLERVIRDVFSPAEFERIVTDSKDIHGRIKEYLETVAPDQLSRLELHDGPLPLLEEHHVTEQVTKALERKIWLPSGGYLIIDRVEAMTVIDVNTGKSVGKTNLEETVVGTNLEAAKEIARQLRLRDIGGIIVVDFIDMLLARNRNEVIRTFQEALAHDKTRSQVFDITPLGLLEMTRKKVSAGLLEAFSEPCPQCEGRGFLLTYEA